MFETLNSRLLFCFLGLGLLISLNVSATSYTWVGPLTRGLWSKAANWQPVGNPTAADDIVLLSSVNITVDIAAYCKTFTVSAATTLTLSAPLEIDSALTIDANLIIAGNSSATIGGFITFGFDNTLVVGATNTITFIAGSSIIMAGNNSNTITNLGTINFTGSSVNYGYQTAFTNQGTVNLTSTTFFGSGNSFVFTNTATGVLTLTSASVFTINDYSSFNNSGTVISNGSTFNVSGSSFPSSQLSNTNAFRATSTTFAISGSNAIVQNSGTFTSNACTFNVSNSGAVTSRIINAGAWTDHRSTFALNDYANYIMNSGNMHLKGSTVKADSTSDGINNSSTFIADSLSTITLGNYQSYINNSGSFYAGTSGSACTINLNGQSAYITNTKNFYVGSTSVIYPTALSATVTNAILGVFTLQSDTYGSASIGPLNTSIATGQPAVFVGIFNVERFFRGGASYDNAKKRWLERNYRVISSPVNTGIKVNGNYISDLNYIAGATAGQTTTANSVKNSIVTGAIGGNTNAGNPSLFLYRENRAPSSSMNGGNFIGINNLTIASALGTGDPGLWTIPSGNGVLFFFRGNSTNYVSKTTSPFIAPENVTLTSSGQLNQQQIKVANWFTPSLSTLSYTTTTANTAIRGFNMVGNPYACSIDWNTSYAGSGISRTNISPTIYVFNPVTNQYDSYLTTSATTGNGTGNATNIIASGQGFFVRATAPGASLVFKETAKAPTSLPNAGNLLMGTPVGQDVVQQMLRLKLVKDSLNYDDIIIGFNSSASAKYSVGEDAEYLPGVNALESLSSMSSDSIKLSINYLPLTNKNQQVIKLNVNATSSGPYSLQKTILSAIPQIYEVWLMDKYKKDSVDLRKNDSYAFAIDLTDTSTFGSNRFSILIRQNADLSIHLLDFAATKAAGGAQVVWKTQNEENYTNFTIERSTDDGKTFDVLGGLTSNSQGTYSFLDKNPLIASDQYRLKIVDLNGTISYSNVVTLLYSNLASNTDISNLSVYPNPSSSVINLAIAQNSASSPGKTPVLQGVNSSALASVAPPSNSQTYGIKIINSSGTIMKTAKSTDPNVQLTVTDLLPGTYILQVVNNTDKSVVGEKTFIKL